MSGTRRLSVAFLAGITFATVVVLAGASGTTAAIPAPSENHTISQPNGETFEAHQWGNEFNHGWETERGYTVTQGEDGWWWYATSNNGAVTPTDRKPGIDQVPTSVSKHVRGAAQSSPQLSSSQSDGSGADTSSAAPSTSSSMPSTGTVDLPVALINYSDTTTGYTNADFQDLVFGADPAIATGPGSVRDYFQEASYGQLDITGGDAGVVGWVTADNGHDYYGGSEIDAQTASLAREAVKKADDDVDFSQYDNDGDGVVDGVIVVHQGAGQETSGDSADIWSHRWSFESAGLDPYETDDGVTVNSYSLQPETYNNRITTVGVIAHETGHLLNMTDLYDTNGSSEGIGTWGLMGSGSWNGVNRAGDSPAHPVAFHKSQQGWVTPTERPLTGEMGVLDSYTGNSSVFRWLDNPNGTEIGGSGEYFLATNRRMTGFDRALPGEGMLVTHVDETRTSNDNEDRKLVDVEGADGNRDLDHSNNVGDAGDVFPGSTNQEAFETTSTPNSLLYDGTESGLTVTDLYVYSDTIALNPVPNATPDPTSVAYDAVHLTETSSETVSVLNDGTKPLNVTNTSISGVDASNFTITNGEGQVVLEPGAATKLTVEFSPSNRRLYTATLVTEHNASDSPTNVSLTGTGVAPDYEVTPSSVVDFGNVSLETGSGQATVTVTNDGSAPLNLTDATVGGPDAEHFSYATESVVPPNTVSPGSSVTYTLNVSVDDLTDRTAWVALGHNVSDRPPVNVTLTGTGVDRNPPTVRDGMVVNTTDESAAVGPGGTVTVSAAVEDAGRIDTVTVNASALGAGTVGVTDGNDDHVYDGTVAVDAQNATEGVHNLTIEATDTRGHVTTNGTASITVDLTAPGLNVTSPAEGALVNTTAVNATGNATKTLTDVESVEVKIDDGGWQQATLTDESWYYNATGLAEQTHELTFRATDAVGNNHATTTRNVTIDSAPPVVEDAQPDPADGVLPNKSVAVSVTANDSVSSVTRVAVDGKRMRDGESGWTGNITATSALGPADATITVVDAAGNRNTTTADYYVGRNATFEHVNGSTYRAAPDGTPVVQSVTVNATQNVSGQRATTGTAVKNPTSVPANNDTALYFPQVNTSVASDSITAATVSLRLDKQRFEQTYVHHNESKFWALESNSWKLADANVTNVTEDAYWYDVRTTRFSALAVTGDVEQSPPSIPSVSPDAGSTTTDQEPTISASYTDDSSGIDVSSVALSVDGASIDDGLSISGSEVSYSTALSPGTHSVTVAVSDEPGNTASRNWTFTVAEEPNTNSGSSGGGGGGGSTGSQTATTQSTSEQTSGQPTGETTEQPTTAQSTTEQPTGETTEQPTTAQSTTEQPTEETAADVTQGSAETTAAPGGEQTDNESGGGVPGFGMGIALGAVLGAALLALRGEWPAH